MKTAARMGFVVGMAISSMATATPVVTESFDYATGSIQGRSGGTGWTGSWQAVSGQSIVNASLEFTGMTGIEAVDGGGTALSVTATHQTLLSRTVDSQSGRDYWMRFLYKREAGAGASSNSLEDFAVWWVDTTDNGSHSGNPNVGVYDRTNSGHHLVGRFDAAPNQNWATSGGVSNVGDVWMVVARVQKGFESGLSDDFDRVDLWTFKQGDSYDVSAFLTPHASVTGQSTGVFDRIGVRTHGLEADDNFVFDEYALGTKLTDVVTLSNSVTRINRDLMYGGGKVLDFENLPNGEVAGNESVFANFGVTFSASGGSASGDVQNQSNSLGKSLFWDGNRFLVLPRNDDPTFNNDAHPFGSGHVYTIDLESVHDQFGFGLQDHTASDLDVYFYLNGELQGQITEVIGHDVEVKTYYYQTTFEFDRVVIDKGDDNDGYGIDNITLAAIPEPATALLTIAGLAAVRRRR